ncbi:MAG: TIGR03936 family radical SAM-associated protein [Clostridium sp.]|nr:TIGR03936 family radical SAM-associated protein [Clostridium sp.]
MKVRIKYTKSERLKFIGHLDVMRYFQKAVKRAKLDIAYSQGFSPHQLMSFAAPLALGVTSEGEYFDAEFHSLVSSDEFVRRLNEQMAADMEVKDVVLLPENAKKAMSIVAASDYMITALDTVPTEVKERLLSYVPHLLEKESIEILKKTKKNEKVEDIKPGILKLSVESYASAKILSGDTSVIGHEERQEDTTGKVLQNQYVEDGLKEDKLYMLLATGSEYNLKPELVIEAVCREIDYPYNRFDYRIHRLETYMKDENGAYCSLLASGQRIEE